MSLRTTLLRWLSTGEDYIASDDYGPQNIDRRDRAIARLAAIETHIKALYDGLKENAHELQELRRNEATRAAEHAAALDAITRVYKRLSARISRENEPPLTEEAVEESVLDMRRRLGR
jgi:hypothetical protein